MENDGKTVRNLRLVALFIVIVGGGIAFATGTWREGSLGLAVSLAVAVYGVGERVKGRDRAVGLAIIIAGVMGVFGHIAQIFLSV